MTHSSKLLLLLLLCVACSRPRRSDMTPQEFVSSLPQVEPAEFLRIEAADSIFFSFIGRETVPLEDASFLLNNRSNNSGLLQISPDGTLIRRVARSGRGPGEIQDILSMVKTEQGGLLAYDQMNRKTIRFNSQIEYVEDILIEDTIERGSVYRVFPGSQPGYYTIELSFFGLFIDPTLEPRRFIARYNQEQGIFEETDTLRDKTYAVVQYGGGAATATQVNYEPRQLIEHDPSSNNLYLFWTGSNTIAEVSPALDTVRTITLDLPSEPLSNADRDSLQTVIRPEMWDALQELLPEVKTPVEAMKVGPEGKIWLQLNYRGETQKWLVLDREGNPQTIVHLPKGSMLTHVSEHHLGIRIDDTTFALYEPL